MPLRSTRTASDAPNAEAYLRCGCRELERIIVHVLVLQHIACEPPGVYEDVLRERGATIHCVELDEDDPLPDWRGFEAIISMGGPMSVNDEERLPWLRHEKALINDAVRAGVPFFGACLGAQLLSASFGASSSRARSRRLACFRFFSRRRRQAIRFSRAFLGKC